jgi:taurine dioxygenase
MEEALMEVVPITKAIGAEIRGIDLSNKPDAATMAAIQQAWADHLVLLFRGQHLSDPQLVEFSRNFGNLDMAPPNEAANKQGGAYVADMREISVISNVVEKGVAIGALGALESEWHTDMSYNPIPPDASLLYSLEVPPSGGDTGFANMYLAYETLPADLRQALRGRECIHDATYTSAGGLRKGNKEVTDVREAPGARHPMVRTHPVTGRNALFLGRRRNAYIIGLPVEESERILDAVWAHARKPEFAFSHQWRVGDLLLWDNRCAMHRRDAFDNSARRIMHRTQVKGTKPFSREDARAA